MKEETGKETSTMNEILQVIFHNQLDDLDYIVREVKKYLWVTRVYVTLMAFAAQGLFSINIQFWILDEDGY